jgi:hypothetical protein
LLSIINILTVDLTEGDLEQFRFWQRCEEKRIVRVVLPLNCRGRSSPYPARRVLWGAAGEVLQADLGARAFSEVPLAQSMKYMDGSILIRHRL